MKSKDRWVNSRTSVYNLAYHIIWCPKYRRKVLVGEIEKELKRLLLLKAEELDCQIESMEVMPDHVHVFIKNTANNRSAFPCATVKRSNC